MDENISISTMKKELETLEKKYGIHFNVYELEQRVISNFKTHYSETHNNVEISSDWEMDKKIKKCNTYQDVEDILNAKFGDTEEKRLEQLINKFGISEKKYFKIPSYQLDIDEAKKTLWRDTENHIVLSHYIPSESYRTSSRAEWESDFFEMLNLMFGYEKIEPSYELHSLVDLTEDVNESQKHVKVRFYKNGNVNIEFSNNDDYEKFRDIMIEKFINKLRKWKE